jgi:hypothetical protein
VAKVKLVIELDDGDAYDKEVIGILRDTPDAGRKELIGSAILYFVRSPSFRLVDKMDKVLQAIEGGAQIHQQSHAKAPTLHYAPSLAPVTPLPSAGPPAGRRHEFVTSAVTPITVLKESTDGADDIFASLATEFR